MSNKDKNLSFIKDVVEGKISINTYYEYICNVQSFYEYIQSLPSIGAYTNEYGGTYYYLISQDIHSLEGSLNTLGTLSSILEKNNVEFKADKTIEEEFDFYLKVKPNWVSFSTEYFRELLKSCTGSNKKETERNISDRIKLDFKFINKKPNWLQDPNWPTMNNKPLLFISQVDISTIKHDKAYAYIFTDSNGNYTVIEQSC